jgi:hypothetical protein
MKLSAPKNVTWIVAVVGGAAGILLHYRVVHLAPLAPYAVFFIAGAWLLLVLATFLKGL